MTCKINITGSKLVLISMLSGFPLFQLFTSLHKFHALIFHSKSVLSALEDHQIEGEGDEGYLPLAR